MSFMKRFVDRRKWESTSFPLGDLKAHGLLPTPTTSHSDAVSCRYCNHRAVNWTDHADIPPSADVLSWLHLEVCKEHMCKRAAGSVLAQVYDKLRANGTQIRVVDLHPRASSPPYIRCSLRTVMRSDRPDYEALSYRWGDKAKDRPFFILLNEVVWRVTPNLYYALESLQLAQHQRTLWVDALAINQFDDEEKSLQVRLMADIYSSSSETQIWLNETVDMRQSLSSHTPLVFSGTVSDNSIVEDFVREHVKFDPEASALSEPFSKMGQNCGCCASQPVFASLLEEHFLGALCILSQAAADVHIRDLPFLRRHNEQVVHCSAWAFMLLALNALVLSPWFKRVWIVQEAVLSPTSVIHFRRYRFPLDMLLRAQRNLQKHKTSCCSSVHTQLPIMQQNIIRMLGEKTSHFRPEVVTKSNSLTYTVWRFLSQDAADPRDKIFGVLSLMSDAYKTCIGQLLPNYKLSMQQCSILAAYLMVSEVWENRSLRMLSLVRKRFTEKAGLPSWIPDWTTHDAFWHPRLLYTKAYRASGDLYMRPCARDKFLALANCGVDRVRHIGPSVNTFNNGELMFDGLREWRRLAAVDEVSTSTQCHHCGQAECLKAPLGQRLDAFYRTLLSDLGCFHAMPTPDGRPARASDANVQDLARLMAWGAENQAKFQYESVPAHLQPIFNLLVFNLSNRRFFLTELGLFGMGPEEMEIGDELRIVFGSDVPFILRPAHDFFRWKFPSDNLKPVEAQSKESNQLHPFQQDYLTACTRRQLRSRTAAFQLQSQPYSSFSAAAFIDWGKFDQVDLASAQAAFLLGHQKYLRMTMLAREHRAIADILEQYMEELEKRLAGQNLRQLMEDTQAVLQGQIENSKLFDMNPGFLDRTHRLVGDCYVHGIMDGQMAAGFNSELLSGSLTSTEVTPYDRIILG